MNRIQRKYHKLGTHETNKIFLSCFDDKIYFQTMLSVIGVNYNKSSRFNNYSEKAFSQLL